MDPTRDDIELAFVREFQCLGQQLAGVSLLERQERVRVAIHKAGKAGAVFHVEPALSYAEAYRVWSGKSLELRAKPRPHIPVDLPMQVSDLKDLDPET
jgi:hypothetical protein